MTPKPRHTERLPPLGVYIHWPFCARICPYCDFNVFKTRDIDASRWTKSLTRDLAYWSDRTKGRRLSSLYFGGGTPSLAPIAVIEGVVAACADLWGFEPEAEIALEANPTDAEGARFQNLKSAGINRLSLGVQSFDDGALKFLKRNHSAREARGAVDLGLRIFERLTFDLIYALPGETPEAWRAALRGALAIGASHLSLYQLTIEPDTPFDRAVRRALFAPPTDDLAADLFDLAQEETARAGLPAYEISNHARPGEESRHNFLYWTGGDYLGAGPGAHGRLTIGGERLALESENRPEAWLAAVEAAGTGVKAIEALGAEAQLVERLSMGLRLVRGMEFGPAERAGLGARTSRLNDLEAQGLIVIRDGRIGASPAGRRVLNAVLAELLC
ncbi:MAG: radical SAM family heme chaperone HemW [Parvularculaceae bacterium]